MMDVFKHCLYREALRLRLMQNLLLISQQDIFLSKLCSGLGYASVLRGGLSTVKGTWLFCPKHELRQWSINYASGKKTLVGLLVVCTCSCVTKAVGAFV